MAGVDGPHTVPQWLIEHFQDPQKIVVGSLMKTPGLNHDEILALTTFMLAQQQRDLPRSYLSPAYHSALSLEDRPSASGEELYGRFCELAIPARLVATTSSTKIHAGHSLHSVSGGCRLCISRQYNQRRPCTLMPVGLGTRVGWQM
jgi:hypothetical protein